MVVLLSTTCLKQTLRIIILHFISILYLLPTSLPFHIYFIACIAFIIVVLVDLLLTLVLNLVLIVLLVSFPVINHVITVTILMLCPLTITFIVSLTLPHIMLQGKILNGR